MNEDSRNWEGRYAIRRFEGFAQGGDDPAVAAARAVIGGGFAGRLTLLTGDVGYAKSRLMDLLLRRRNCHDHAGPPHDPCGQCPGCASAAEGGGRLFDLSRRFTPRHGPVRDVIDERVEQWARWRGGPARHDAQFVLALDDVHSPGWVDFGWLQGTVDAFGGAGVLFLLATSAPEVLPASMRSRAQEIRLRAPSAGQLARWLETILERETISCEPGFPEWLATRASRRPRAVLNLAWQLSLTTRHFTRAGAERTLPPTP